MINRKPLIISASISFGLIIIISFAPALTLKYLAKQQMLELGAEQTEIESLYLNPWTGYVKLTGLSATAKDQPELKVGLLEAELSYQQLWKKRLQISSLVLNDIELHLYQGQQWRLGPLTIPEPPAESETSITDPEQPATEWRAGINSFNLSAINVSLRNTQMSQRLSIETATLQRLHQWTPQQQTQLNLTGQLNDSPVVISTQGTPLATQPELELQLKLNKLDLAPLSSPWLTGLEGKLSADLTLHLKQTESETSLSQSGDIILADFSFTAASLAVSSQSLSWQGRAEQQLSAAVLKQATTNSALAIEQFELTQPGLGVQEQSIQLAGQISAIGVEQFNYNGEISTGPAHILLPELKISNQARRWNGTVDLTLSDQGLQQLITNGGLELHKLHVAQGDLDLTEDLIDLNGRFETNLEQLNFDGELTTQPSLIHKQHLLLATDQRNWKGKLAVDLESAIVTAFNGDVIVGPILLSHQDGDPLVSLSKLTLSNIELPETNRLHVGQLQLDELIIAPLQPLFSLDQLKVTDISGSETSSSIDTILLGASHTEVELDSNKKPHRWLALADRITGTETETETETTTQAQAEPEVATETNKKPDDAEQTTYPFTLNQFALGQPAKIDLIELSAATKKAGKPYHIVINTLSLKQVDTTSDQASPFDFKAQANRLGSINLSGDYTLFAEQVGANWQGKISGMAMPPFSKMMQSQTGYQIESGKLALDANGTITKGYVDSHNELVINNFIVAKAAANSSDEFDGQLGMPLSTAVSLLTDSDDNLHLSIPVSGALNDPKFGVQSAINVVLAKVAREATMGYLAMSLLPYSAVLTLGRVAVNAIEGSAINLDPVYFEPGSAEITEQGIDYLSKIGGMLAEREALRLKLCGQSVAADHQWLRDLKTQEANKNTAGTPASAPSQQQPQEKTQEKTQQQPIAPITPEERETLQQLAEERGDAVMIYLVEQLKVKNEQLFSCLAEVDSTMELQPQVRLGL